MQLAEILRDARGVVVAEVVRGKCLFHDQLEGMERSKSTRAVADRIWHCCEEWCIRGKKGFGGRIWRKLDGTSPKVDEWRLGRFRVFWHNDGNVILVSEITKKQGRRAKRSIDSAEQLAWRFQQAKSAGEIQYINLDEVDDGQE